MLRYSTVPALLLLTHYHIAVPVMSPYVQVLLVIVEWK